MNTNEFDIIEHPMVASWVREYVKTEPLGVCFLTQGNTNLFHKMWGKEDGLTKKSKYWTKDHLGITIYVYSDDSSSFYKVKYLGDRDMFLSDKKMGSYLTGFLTKLTKDILSS